MLDEAVGEVSPISDQRASKEYRVSLLRAGLEEFLGNLK